MRVNRARARRPELLGHAGRAKWRRCSPELRAISAAWLAESRAREKGFSLGAFRDDYLHAPARRVVRQDGAIVAFANVLCTAAAERGQRRPHAPTCRARRPARWTSCSRS